MVAPRKLNCTLPNALWAALEARSRNTGETLDEVVVSCLGEALDLSRHSIFQISTSAALVKGVYQGTATVAEVKRHGDFGLGTFEDLDGEGMQLDGDCFQARGDGSVTRPADPTLVPFWVTTRFQADRTETLSGVRSWADLCDQLTKLRTSDNLLAAIRLGGIFEFIRVRTACKSAPGTDLVTASSRQKEFEFEGVRGTLLGFFTPTYARTINVPGYHLHLLTDDRKHGGHVLEVRASRLQASLHLTSDLHLILPGNEEFLAANLTQDPAAALAKAEGAGAAKS
jgi:acetolactate decarboxylase